MFLDDTASQPGVAQPLMQFRKEIKNSMSNRLCRAVQITITAMEISVDNSSLSDPGHYGKQPQIPTPGSRICKSRCIVNVPRCGIRQRSGRTLAGAITSLMSGEAYKTIGAHQRGQRPVRRVRGQSQYYVDCNGKARRAGGANRKNDGSG